MHSTYTYFLTAETYLGWACDLAMRVPWAARYCARQAILLANDPRTAYQAHALMEAL